MYKLKYITYIYIYFFIYINFKMLNSIINLKWFYIFIYNYKKYINNNKTVIKALIKI